MIFENSKSKICKLLIFNRTVINSFVQFQMFTGEDNSTA